MPAKISRLLHLSLLIMYHQTPSGVYYRLGWMVRGHRAEVPQRALG